MQSPLAAGTTLEPFFELEGVPVFCNVLYEDAASARAAARGDITLGVCPSSGFVFNTSFDPAKLAYSPRYENSLHFSPRFDAWARGMAAELTRPHGDDELVIDVGCGQGDFLRTIAESKRCHAIGFDQSIDAMHEEDFGNGSRFELRNAYLDAESFTGAPKLLMNRHVLEHVADPLALLRTFRGVLERRQDARLYLEVPNAHWSFVQLGVWDLIYEHCGYFAPCALREALTRAGFDIEVLRPEFGEQFLSAVARVRAGEAPKSDAAAHDGDDSLRDVREMLELARSFRARYDALVHEAQQKLERACQNGARVVLWGAGSKGAMLLDTLERGQDVCAAIDKNPRKVGKHLAGSGHRIYAPASLPELAPEVVLVANPLYRDEIANECRELGLNARVETI